MFYLGSISKGPVSIGAVTFLVQIGLAFPRDCLERFHLGQLIGSNWVCFRVRFHIEPYSWKRVEQFQIGLDRFFLTHLPSRCVLRNFRVLVPNGTVPLKRSLKPQYVIHPVCLVYHHCILVMRSCYLSVVETPLMNAKHFSWKYR